MLAFQAVKAQCSGCYVEQLAVTFSGANSYTNLSYNISAVEQTNTNGYGPAYILNGLSNKGFWYQVGLSYDWNGQNVSSGFKMAYEIWSLNGLSVFPVNHTLGQMPFSCAVKPGDTVGVSIKLFGGNVVLEAMDFNSGCSANLSYSSEGATSFVGSTYLNANSNGFFTGLMTQWHSPTVQFFAQNVVNYTSVWTKTNSTPQVPPTGLVWIAAYSSSPSTYAAYDAYPSSGNTETLTYQGAAVSYENGVFKTGSINPTPLVLSSSISNITEDGKCLLSPSVTVSGGTKPYNFSLFINSTLAQSVISYLNTYSFSTNCGEESYGKHSYYVSVQDNSGQSGKTANATLNFTAPLVIYLMVPPEVDINHAENITINYSGGVAPYKLETHLDGVSYGNATVFNMTTFGTHYLYVNVTDAKGVSATSQTYNFTVNVLPNISLNYNGLVADAGSPIKFSLVVNGGAKPYNISWYENNIFRDNHLIGYGSDVNVTPTSTLTFEIYAKLVDASNYSLETAPVIVNVNSPLQEATYSVTPANTFFFNDNVVKVEMTASGGTPPYTYDWYVNGALYASTSGSSVTLSLEGGKMNSVYGVAYDSIGNGVEGQMEYIAPSVNYTDVILTITAVIAALAFVVVILRGIKRSKSKTRSNEQQ